MSAKTSPPKQKRKWFKLVIYNLLIVIIIFGSAEFYLNSLLNHPQNCPGWLYPALRQYHEQFDREVIQFKAECAHFDSSLFYKLNSGEFIYGSREFSNLYQVNSMGFRDDEASLDSPEVIVLGDSYAMGWGVDQNETFPQLLEKETGKKVLNTGVSSYGTIRECVSIQNVNTDSLEFLIIQYCPNDAGENKYYTSNGYQFKASQDSFYYAAVQKHLNLRRYYPFKHLYKIAGLLKGSKKEKPESTANPHPSDNISPEEAFVTVLKQEVKIPEDAQIIVFSLEAENCNSSFIDAVQKLPGEAFPDSLRERMSFLDLSGLIGPEHRFILDPHLNAKGHAVVSQAISEHLVQLNFQ